MVLQATRRGSKKSRGIKGEQSRSQLAGTLLDMSCLHQAAALQPQPGTVFPAGYGSSPLSPAAPESHGKQQESNG